MVVEPRLPRSGPENIPKKQSVNWTTNKASSLLPSIVVNAVFFGVGQRQAGRVLVVLPSFVARSLVHAPFCFCA